MVTGGSPHCCDQWAKRSPKASATRPRPGWTPGKQAAKTDATGGSNERRAAPGRTAQGSLELGFDLRPDRTRPESADSDLIDEHTKQALAIRAGYSIRAVDAITVLEAAIARYGTHKRMRSDNRPEFIAKAIQDWLRDQSVQSYYIHPGSPRGAGLR
jgi:Integrase core domain